MSCIETLQLFSYAKWFVQRFTSNLCLPVWTLNINMAFSFTPLFRSTLTHFCSSIFFVLLVSFHYLHFPSVCPLFSILYLVSFQNFFAFLIYYRCFPHVRHWWKRWEPAEDPGLSQEGAVLLFTKVNGNEGRVCTALQYGRADYAAGPLLRQMHSHLLAYNNGWYVFVLCMTVTMEEIKSHRNPYSFQTMEEVPLTLVHVFYADVYDWDSQEMTCIAAEMPCQMCSWRLVR